jgi:hypothetical protein
MNWLFYGSEYIDDGTYFGFVYLIENTITGRKYIGRKYFTQAGYRTVKGKRKRIRKESDWKDYYGSNETLKAEVEQIGKDKFVRTILHLCKSKSECSYLETSEIFKQDALLREDFYNQWVTCKITSKHLTNLQITDITK